MKHLFRWWGFCTLFIYPELSPAQNGLPQDTAVTTREAVVTGVSSREKLSTISIEPLPASTLLSQGAFSLSDGLSKVPGLSQLSTGPGISKPVVRGLYGNRVLILLSGLRFDNQQWQDEHGLGLANFGISRMEIIKGPLSVLYGTEASGGIIQIQEEGFAAPRKRETELLAQFHSNTLGFVTQASWKQSGTKSGFKIRIGTEHHADYSDGSGKRVLNSRFGGWYLKTGYWLSTKKWRHAWNYQASYNQFGFIFSDLGNFFAADSRWSMPMNGPHHIVLLNMANYNGTRHTRFSSTSILAGIQSNYRAEDEGGGQLSLRMHLLTAQYALRKQGKRSWKGWQWQWSNQGMLQTNTNYGGRRLIPDARIAEESGGLYLMREYRNWNTEFGAGAGFRYIQALLTGLVNTPDKAIPPFERFNLFGNGMAGINWLPGRAWNIKAHLASGVRAPNLAELCSNGLHEGIYTYELGNPDLKLEKNVMAEINWSFARKWLDLGQAVFVNRFWDYIYLQPGTDTWFGFPIQRFVQSNVWMYGSEIKLGIHPEKWKGLALEAAGSALIGQMDNGTYLPYMPAWKVSPGIRYKHTFGQNQLEAWVNMDLVLQQELLAPAEIFTPGYQLLNAGCQLQRKAFQLGINGNNLLNELYYDHLSRLKPFGIYNMGRNLSAYLKINLIK